MKTQETGPGKPPHQANRNRSDTELTGLVTLAVRTGRGGNRVRTLLKNALQARTAPEQGTDSTQQAFYQHKLAGNTYAQVSHEFCQLATSPAQSVVHVQLAVSPSFALQEADWYVLIRYCLFCWSQSDSPVVVFCSPMSNSYMELFILRDSSLLWNEPTSYQQWLINRMMSIQMGLWLRKPVHLPTQSHLWYSYSDSLVNYELHIASAIYESMATNRFGTIHQLADYLNRHYGLEAHYRSVDTSFYDLRLRHARLPWVGVSQLSLGQDTIQYWLDFNRVFKQTPLQERVLRGIQE